MIDALRTCGNTVQICHYKVTYNDERRSGEELTRKFVTEEEARNFAKGIDGTVISIDTSDCDWMDGMEITSYSGSPMNEAVKVYHLGQAGYEAQCRREESQKPEQIRADLDYIMLMGGF